MATRSCTARSLCTDPTGRAAPKPERIDRVTGWGVRELRTTKGMSQRELANALGVSRQTINSIENEHYVPSLPLAIAIARFFQSTVEEIFTPDREQAR
jgi:putative transcriptional regulator